MKSIDSVIQGEESQLPERVCENLKTTPILLKKWEAVFDKTSDIESQIEITVRILRTSPLFF
jgi:hypothetical protein